VLEDPYVGPTNEVEGTLARIWSQVLGVAQIGVKDNYFRLGGDSIRSIEIRARAQASGLNVSIQQLFQFQTIRALAQHLSTKHWNDGAHPAKHVQPFSLISEADRRKLPTGLEDAFPLYSPPCYVADFF
jgi:aryl carrier-like protein